MAFTLLHDRSLENSLLDNAGEDRILIAIVTWPLLSHCSNLRALLDLGIMVLKQ
jgi:hypothetical protein